MPTYSRSKGGTISGGVTKKFEIPAFEVPAGEAFSKFIIVEANNNYSGLGLREDSAKIGFKTERSAQKYLDYLHWSGGKSYVWVHADNTRSTTITVKFTTKVVTDYHVTCAVTGSGTMSANITSCAMGTVITLYPSPATGYYLASYSSSPSVTISGNQFSMPGSNVTITANFAKIDYAINKVVSPAGAGTITAPATGQMGDTISISQTPNTGYRFSHWSTSPAVTISSGSFTMPNGAVTLTANYLQYSTATVDKTDLTGGEYVTLNITPASADFTHKYKLSFGTGMETQVTDITAGVTSLAIAVPRSWAEEIPSAESKSGGTLTVYTYADDELLGSYVIEDLVYNVSPEALPEIGTITTSVEWPGQDPNIGAYYVQNHNGVRIQTSASGADGSSVIMMIASIDGYSGSDYRRMVTGSAINFASGLLTNAGTATIRINATDSRGRTASKTATITVNAYSKPGGTLTVWRVDANGDPDDIGENAKYTITSQFTQIGSNALTRVLTSQGATGTPALDTGDLLPGNRQTFSGQQEYTITLTLTDSLDESVTITAKLASAKFIFYVDAGGDRIGFMKAANQQIPSGKDSTIEISANTQIFIGNVTLEQYIQNIINGN